MFAYVFQKTSFVKNGLNSMPTLLLNKSRTCTNTSFTSAAVNVIVIVCVSLSFLPPMAQ